MARRRAPYLDKANGVWIGAVYLGVGADGKRRFVKVSAKTHAACLKKLAALEQQVVVGTVLTHAPEKTTVSAWLDAWLEERRPEIHVNTFEDYRSKIENHLKPRVGRVLLHKLTPLHCSGLFRDMGKAGVGRRTQQIAHVVFNGALKRAKALKLIGTNPLEEIARPKTDRRKKAKKVVWTVEDARKFLEAVSKHEHAALFLLAVATGMRQSELFGVLWEHVDLVRGFLRVEWALHEVLIADQATVDPRCGPGLELWPTKTESSERTIALPTIVWDALQAHRDCAPSGALFAFLDKNGRPIRASSFRKEWGDLLVAAKVPAIAFKQLRHTCLTLMMEAGVSVKAAQSLAGHSDSSLTLEVYAQATKKMAREAAVAMDHLLGPGEPRSSEGPD